MSARPADRISAPPPAFGEADLSNCEREQIHLAGSIQPHGALLVLKEPEGRIVQASANAAHFLGLPHVHGLELGQLGGDLAGRVRARLAEPLRDLPVAVRASAGVPRRTFDCLMHRAPSGELVIELEVAGPLVDLRRDVEGAVHRILEASSIEAVCDETAQVYRELVGYDRVMVYRFDEHGHGEVVSERRVPGVESLLGNRYPASDIPQIARRLYERNRVRVLADVNYQPVPLIPRISPLSGEELDMSLCFLRSMSPIHIQYLKNMGVCATLVVSLLVRGRLWGLIACHHYAPRFVPYPVRSACELVAELVATRLAALESFVQAQAELAVRRLEQRMVEAVAREGDWRSALFDGSGAILQMVRAGGAALVFEGQVMTVGDVPATPQLRALVEWLDRRPSAPVHVTDALGQAESRFAALAAVAAGVLAVPVSSAAGEYLLWFRPERVRTVTWAGDPSKPVEVGDDPSQLSPRRSFAQWRQVVKGTSEPWTEAELSTARLIGESVADVVLQFRAVRMLIAEDQLRQVGAQVRDSGQPLVVADPTGRVIARNRAFDELFRNPPAPLERLDDLASLFAPAALLRDRLAEWRARAGSWRAEVELVQREGRSRQLMVRADAVRGAHGRLLGYVLLFTDLGASRAAEEARRSFQESILERHWSLPAPLGSDADLLYRRLFSLVVGNAQLAALEITHGLDLERIPEALESVRQSVTRAAELLERILRHAANADTPRR